MSRKRRILLLRSNEDKPDPYETVLKDFEVVQIPVLQFEFIHQDQLVHKLNSPKKYNAIVFTSVRGVEAVSRVINGDEKTTLHPSWHMKKCYVVGEITASKVLDKLRWNPSNVLGREAGKASSLGTSI